MIIIFFILNLTMFAACISTAYRFMKRFPFSEKLIASFLLMASQITLTLLLLGVVLKNLGFLPIIFLNGFISILALILLRKSVPDALREFYRECLDFTKFILDSKDWFLYLILILFVAESLWILIKIYFFPPDVWDVFAYHLHPVIEWFQRGSIPDFIDTPVTRLNRNPMGPKLLSFWIVKFFGNLSWVEFPQFFYAILTVLSSYALMLKMEIKKITALKYSILIFFIPLILVEARTSQDHLALMGVLSISFIYFSNLVFQPYSNDDEPNGCCGFTGSFLTRSGNLFQFLLLGMSFGLLLGTKISGIHVLGIFFLALLVTKGFRFSACIEFIRKNFLGLIGCTAAMFILGSYWYLKDDRILTAFRNTASRLPSKKLILISISIPVAVVLIWAGVILLRRLSRIKWFRQKKFVSGVAVVLVLLAIIGIVQNRGLVKTFALGFENPSPLLSDRSFYAEHPVLYKFKSDFTRNILLFPFRVKDIGTFSPYTPDFLDQSGFGVQFFGFGIAAYMLVFFLCFRKKYRNSLVGFTFAYSILLLLTYFIYYYSAANYRLFMFFPIFGIILWAFVSEKLITNKWALRFLDVLIVVMILFNIGATVFDGNLKSMRLKTTFTVSDPLARSSVKFSSFFKKGDEWNFIDKFLSPGEPIGYLGHFDSWVSPYFDNGMIRRIYHLRGLPGFDLQETNSGEPVLEFSPLFKASLKDRKIHVIHLNPQGVRSKDDTEKPVVIHDADVKPIAPNLYYYRW